MNKTFEEIEVYQKAQKFAINIFRLTESSKINKNIIYQLERASLSISNNIAEGFELQSNKQLIKFLFIAKGSCGECRNLLAIANKLEQVDDEHHNMFRAEAISISKQLSNFIKYLERSKIQ